MKVKEALYNALFGPDRSGASTSSQPTTSLAQAAALLQVPPDSLSALSSHSIHALQNLKRYVPRAGSEPCPSSVPAYRRAAVLLGLFAGRNGELYVILSKRSSRLRSHGGDTAIPGGRFEPTDRDLEFTARREAFEETGLPIDSTKAVKLCELPPFLSANELVVTPFVVFLTDHSIQPHLNPREVDSLFSLPLVSFLYHNPPRPLRRSLHLPPTPDPEALRHMPANEVSAISDWHTCRDILWLGGHRIRRHTFWDERNPIRGLTSDILILAANIAYEMHPQFVVRSPGQPRQTDLINLAFNSPLAVKKFRVRPRMQFLKTPDAFSFNRTERTNDELEQPQDERSDFQLAPPMDGKDGGKEVAKPKL
ncbi:NUDIX hydrolase domain protein [Kalmanozyma brasiliensis GHG001]|uniref:Nudix hydrolase domain-containing protein n=1 Tax=Kalmanozyma brasiliensis (strain GHG001) TaxID=1365824 RepID=V5EV97_KALBG|nr:NUDIX hydrolase domain protein [Kalmanozyma brasiliensis GHG001]EST06094.1 NUDIX hydrolase domain protein [Kalmanozyma brasiliensis GHG001]